MGSQLSSGAHIRWVDERDAVRQPVLLGIRATSALTSNIPITLIDISELGAQIATPFRFQPGSEVTINADGGVDHICRVVWSGYGFAGLQFAAALSNQDVSRIISMSNQQGKC